MNRRRVVVAAGILSGCWILTLGIFHERSLRCDFHVASGDPWVAFENGDETFFTKPLIDPGNDRRIGIPFLFYSVTDRPPYGLTLAFTANAAQQVESITIESITVQYDDGQVAMPVDNRHAQTTRFTRDDYDLGSGKKPYLGARLSFPECLSRRDSFWATISGSYAEGEASIPYQTRIRVDMRDEEYWYPGWIALGLRGL